MGKNRIEEMLRCPTLEQPSLEYFEVRLPWQGFAVRRETAERVLEAMLAFERPTWIRIETVGGCVAWVRTEHVVFVREWSSAQRESERRFWKQIDDEYEQAEKASAGPEAEAAPEGAQAEKPVYLDTIALVLSILALVLVVLGAVVVG